MSSKYKPQGSPKVVQTSIYHYFQRTNPNNQVQQNENQTATQSSASNNNNNNDSCAPPVWVDDDEDMMQGYKELEQTLTKELADMRKASDLAWKHRAVVRIAIWRLRDKMNQDKQNH